MPSKFTPTQEQMRLARAAVDAHNRSRALPRNQDLWAERNVAVYDCLAVQWPTSYLATMVGSTRRQVLRWGRQAEDYGVVKRQQLRLALLRRT